MGKKQVIKSVSGNQFEILKNIMALHNHGDGFDCDITYSTGGFYGKHKFTNEDGEKTTIEIPEPFYKFDVNPQTPDTEVIDPWGAIPLENESITSIVVDLPFVIAKGPSLEVDNEGQNIILKRFGVYYPSLQMYQSYLHWIREAYRVLKKNGLCVFKTQATISGGVYHDTPRFATMVAESAGFILDDEFILTSKNRINSGAVHKQQHSRRHHCSFLVFKKYDGKKYDAAVYENIRKKTHPFRDGMNCGGR